MHKYCLPSSVNVAVILDTVQYVALFNTIVHKIDHSKTLFPPSISPSKNT